MTPFIIPVVAIVMGLLIPIVAIIVDYRKRSRIYELHHKERLAAIEKGMEAPPLPPELLGSSHDGRARGPRYLLKGLVWLFIGLALMLALHYNEGRLAIYGLIPTGIGLAYLIYYALEGRKVEEEFRKAETKPGSPVSSR